MKEIQANQYERIARGLDGSGEPLDPQEQAVADEIRRLEADLRAELDTAVPPAVLSRVRGRLAERFGRRRQVIRLGWFAGVAAAAAGLLLSVAVLYLVRHADQGPPGGQRFATPNRVGPAAPVRRAAKPDPRAAALAETLLRTTPNTDLDVLDRKLAELETDSLAEVEIETVDVELDALERDFQRLLLEDSRALLPEI